MYLYIWEQDETVYTGWDSLCQAFMQKSVDQPAAVKIFWVKIKGAVKK